MAISLEMTKNVEKLSLELKKRDVQTIIPCQVKMAMDVSGSFDDEHRGGYTQHLLNRFVPFALLFDKDGVIDAYAFSHHSQSLPLIDSDNYANYIRKEVIGCDVYNGGTSFAPVIGQILNDASPKSQERVVQRTEKSSGILGLFGKKKVVEEKVVVNTGHKEKELVFFVTDGESSDPDQSRKLIEQASKDNVFFVFISVGSSDIRLFKQSFENTPYSIYLRFTKAELQQLSQLSDEDLYEKLLKPSLIAWMNAEI